MAKARRALKEELIQKRKILVAFSRHSNGVQIPMLTIPVMFKEVEDAVAAGADADQAARDVIDKYRVRDSKA